jgi:ABC-type branched-subunit amino acid transport system substrate-binding protein
MEVLEAARVPLVGAVNVRDDARRPERCFVFPARAGTFHEATAIARLREAAPEAVLLSVLPKSLAPVKRSYAALGGSATMIGHSSMAMDDFRQELGPLAGDMVFSQIMPSPYGGASPLGQEYRRLLALHRPDAKPSYNGIDGFLEAKVLVEGLRRAGERPSREGLVSALESITHQDFGGPLVTYGKGVRAGSTFVDLVMLRRDGALVV